VFTQTAGIHADGDNKIIYILMIYYQNDLVEKTICSRKTSGKTNIERTFKN
jgi:hypothetical protein